MSFKECIECVNALITLAFLSLITCCSKGCFSLNTHTFINCFPLQPFTFTYNIDHSFNINLNSCKPILFQEQKTSSIYPNILLLLVLPTSRVQTVDALNSNTSFSLAENVFSFNSHDFPGVEKLIKLIFNRVTSIFFFSVTSGFN